MVHGGEKVPGWTVMRNCASGMQALDSGINNILAGRSNLVLAGGVDALSRAPLLYNDKMVNWFSDLAATRSSSQRISAFAELAIHMNALFEHFAKAKTPHEKTVLKTQIDATDTAIDQLVYELYGLTDDEIKIVEAATQQ